MRTLEIINWKRIALSICPDRMNELLLKFLSLDKEYRQLGIPSPIDSVTRAAETSCQHIGKSRQKTISPDRIEEEIETAEHRIFSVVWGTFPRSLKWCASARTWLSHRGQGLHHQHKMTVHSYHMIIVTLAHWKRLCLEIQIQQYLEFLGNMETYSLRYKYPAAIFLRICRMNWKTIEAAFLWIHGEMATIRGGNTQHMWLNEIKTIKVANILEIYGIYILWMKTGWYEWNK